jgi:hypothetical protein
MVQAVSIRLIFPIPLITESVFLESMNEVNVKIKMCPDLCFHVTSDFELKTWNEGIEYIMAKVKVKPVVAQRVPGS